VWSPTLGTLTERCRRRRVLGLAEPISTSTLLQGDLGVVLDRLVIRVLVNMARLVTGDVIVHST
jgi:hypothetical protein